MDPSFCNVHIQHQCGNEQNFSSLSPQKRNHGVAYSEELNIFLLQEAHKLLQPADKTLKTMAIEFAEYQVSYIKSLWKNDSLSTTRMLRSLFIL